MTYRPYSVYKAERLLRRRRRRLLFGVVGLIAVVGIVVGASYLWLYLQWQKTQIDDPSLQSVLDSTPATNLFPAPAGTMNLLILGVDERGWEDKRSDTMILVHADPINNYLSILSLPRDLRVEVPGNGMQKLNFAYAKGGPALAVQTAEALTGVDMTNYMEVSLDAFKALTDAVGGVYIDVDKHYLQTDWRIDMLDILPGYQKLDGHQGLDYVRYRHDNNMDFGRQQRQQRFLASLREQALHWDLAFKLPDLVKAMTDNIQTTVSFEEMRNLAYWAVSRLGSGRIRQLAVVGKIQTIDGQSFVVADEEVLRKKSSDFANPPSTSTAETASATDSTQTAPAAGASSTASISIDSSQFITNPASIANASLWTQIAAETPFAVMAPGYLPVNYVYFQRNPESGPGYDIDTGGGTAKGLKMVYQLVRDGNTYEQYLGIMQTDWLEAPAASPGQQVVYNDITYTVVGTYDMPERVWWRKDGVLYWVSNTILHYLDAEELLKVAASMMTMGSGTAQ